MFDRFSNAIEARGQFVSQGRSAGNENRRWHGTRRECSLGDKGNTAFCGSSTCSLCCIVKTSFDLSLWGKKTGWGRYEILLFLFFRPKTYNTHPLAKVRQRNLYLLNVFKVRAHYPWL